MISTQAQAQSQPDNNPMLFSPFYNKIVSIIPALSDDWILDSSVVGNKIAVYSKKLNQRIANVRIDSVLPLLKNIDITVNGSLALVGNFIIGSDKRLYSAESYNLWLNRLIESQSMFISHDSLKVGGIYKTICGATVAFLGAYWVSTSKHSEEHLFAYTKPKQYAYFARVRVDNGVIDSNTIYSPFIVDMVSSDRFAIHDFNVDMTCDNPIRETLSANIALGENYGKRSIDHGSIVSKQYFKSVGLEVRHVSIDALLDRHVGKVSYSHGTFNPSDKWLRSTNLILVDTENSVAFQIVCSVFPDGLIEFTGYGVIYDKDSVIPLDYGNTPESIVGKKVPESSVWSIDRYISPNIAKLLVLPELPVLFAKASF